MKLQSYSLLLIFFVFASPQLLGQKKLQYTDKAYEPSIKTIQFYPTAANVQSTLEPPAIEMNGNKEWKLSFDDLRQDADYYYVRFIHCNADWTPSRLRPNMYLKRYNEFEIVDFEFSSESRTQYVHYEFAIPQLEKSGNYVAVVYRNQKKDDIILSKRFSVYDNSVGVGARIDRSAQTSERLINQRVEVTMNYNNLSTIDPAQQFTVVVRQNERPDRTKVLTPTYIDENDKVIRFQNLGEENEFKGGNEFRHFDLSSVNFGGRNVANTRFINNKPVTQLRIDQPARASYLINLDINGKFYVQDVEGRNSTITAEYVTVNFTLESDKLSTPVYVIGAFNQWRKTPESQMQYNPQRGAYESQQLIKQGWYDYTYQTGDSEVNPLENSFYETENMYEVFVYYRPMGARGDELVGYQKVNFNLRR